VLDRCGADATPTIRVSLGLKKKMEQNPADWSQEIRAFLEERIKQMELMKVLEEIELRAKKRKTKVDSAALIRADRGMY
jgi:hypothetical protein